MDELTRPDHHQDEGQGGPSIFTVSNPYAAQSSAPLPAPYQRRIVTPVLLYLATCLTTFWAGYAMGNGSVVDGLQYSVCVMLILTAHELGHFFQAVRYQVPASLPYFIPMPSPPLGTMGAVIAMRGNMGNRKTLFDIGISGPLAGLVPAIICCIVGLRLSEVRPIPRGATIFGDPWIFKQMAQMILGPIPPGYDVVYHPIAFAGWVGLFITALNLMPIGQLDGGHILYALLRRKAHPIATFLLMAAIVCVVLTGYWQWSLMLFLLAMVGPKHPPTGDDNVPLGTTRIVLGWLTLLFVVIGFTPQPFKQF